MTSRGGRGDYNVRRVKYCPNFRDFINGWPVNPFPDFDPQESLLNDKPGLEIFLGFLQKSADPVSGKGKAGVFNVDSMEPKIFCYFLTL